MHRVEGNAVKKKEKMKMSTVKPVISLNMPIFEGIDAKKMRQIIAAELTNGNYRRETIIFALKNWSIGNSEFVKWVKMAENKFFIADVPIRKQAKMLAQNGYAHLYRTLLQKTSIDEIISRYIR